MNSGNKNQESLRVITCRVVCLFSCQVRVFDSHCSSLNYFILRCYTFLFSFMFLSLFIVFIDSHGFSQCRFQFSFTAPCFSGFFVSDSLFVKNTSSFLLCVLFGSVSQTHRRNLAMTWSLSQLAIKYTYLMTYTYNSLFIH